MFFKDTGKHLQEVGQEYGTTTGRRRRCGWLDLVVLRYSTLVNGYTWLNLTKLDVLDRLPELKVAIGYQIAGKEVESFPGLFSSALSSPGCHPLSDL
jgi:adenylosuccinate synthase